MFDVNTMESHRRFFAEEVAHERNGRRTIYGHHHGAVLEQPLDGGQHLKRLYIARATRARATRK